ncbi:MAG: hypothetical protein ACM3NH_02625 [Candidatus Saccharibacteria bacterium]
MAKTKKGSKKIRRKEYPVYLLAIVLGAVMFLEGIAIGVASGSDVRDALSILDMTGQVQEVAADLSIIAQPMVFVVQGIYSFYQLAATEMTALLSGMDLQTFVLPYSAVVDFYQASATEMYHLLDLSSLLPLA